MTAGMKRAKARRTVLRVAVVCAVVGTVLLLFSVLGMRFSGALLWCAALAAAAWAGLDCLAEKHRAALWARRVLSAALMLGIGIFAVLEGFILSAAHADPPEEVACVIILGAGVNGETPSLTLKLRLDAALAYLADAPQTPVLVTGGQGGGENITEAEAMYRYLTAHGIAPERIWREERASSTRENFAFSMQVLAEHGIEAPVRAAVVSDDFHLCRARYLAAQYGLDAVCVASRLPYFTLRVNYYIREAFALANCVVLGG